MIVPSIDIQGGRTVQLVGGRNLALEAGDPQAHARRFARVGEVAVVDLDAALRQGSNARQIEELLRLAPCRVGGGIRDVDTARAWLDRGARRVILGTAARPEVLRELPRERTIAAVDCLDGEVVVDGWRERTGVRAEDRLRELAPYVGGFLVTFVESEGLMRGIDLDRVARCVTAAAPVRVTVAGGVTTAHEVAAIDRLGADAQVGMALYTGRLGLAEAFTAPLESDRTDGLWPTIVCDESGVALGLAWSDLASVREALETGTGVYRSRTRGLWRKGANSGATQELVSIGVDCDRDALRFVVRQSGSGFCHAGTHTCFGASPGLSALEASLRGRRRNAPAESYVARLFDNPDLLAAKIREEGLELANARTRVEVVHEAADVLFFTLARLVAEGVTLGEVERELERRSLRITRRGGAAKPAAGDVS